MPTASVTLVTAPRRRPVTRIRLSERDLPAYARPLWDWGMEPGDIVLYRRDDTLLDLAIAAATRSLWIHAGMLARDAAGQWVILDVQQWHGGRETPLCEAVRENPGHWDWFHANAGDRWSNYNREVAVARMRGFVDRPYGWASLARDGLSHLPLVGLAFADFRDGDEDGRRPFCSMATTIAEAAGGVEIAHHLPHALTEPVHVAQSLFHEYLGTFWPAKKSGE